MRPRYTPGCLKQDQTQQNTKTRQGTANKRIPLPHNRQNRATTAVSKLAEAQQLLSKTKNLQPIFYYFLNTAWIVNFIWLSGYTNRHQADDCSILSTTFPKEKKNCLDPIIYRSPSILLSLCMMVTCYLQYET